MKLAMLDPGRKCAWLAVKDQRTDGLSISRSLDLGTDTGKVPAFFAGHETVGFHDRANDGVHIKRTDGPKVDDFGGNALLCKLFNFMCGKFFRNF